MTDRKMARTLAEALHELICALVWSDKFMGEFQREREACERALEAWAAEERARERIAEMYRRAPL